MLMQAIDSYLQLRRAGGYQLRDTEALLKEFACFAAERGEIHIKADSAIAWAARATSLRQRARRLSSLILFARYIRAEDAEHQVPPAGVFAHHPRSRRLPHIFTPAQIAAILAEAKQLPPEGSLRPHTFYTLFGLVAACVFFFQAEDGIRDRDVTGVQTCALPIYLVFGTLHTTTAASTVDRIIDQFPADRQSQIRVMLSESLKGVIAQTLCKRIAGGRSEERRVGKECRWRRERGRGTLNEESRRSM